MYGFGGVCLSEVMLSISELNVVGMGGRDKRTSWSDLVGVRQKGKPTMTLQKMYITFINRWVVRQGSGKFSVFLWREQQSSQQTQITYVQKKSYLLTPNFYQQVICCPTRNNHFTCWTHHNISFRYRDFFLRISCCGLNFDAIILPHS